MDLLARQGIPQAALVHLATRRGELSDQVRGRVLELESAGAPNLSPHLGAVPTERQGFDTIVSLGALASASNPVELLSMVMAALAPNGQLIFIEPTLRPGLTGRFQRQAGLEVDIVSLIREAGFTITNLHKTQLKTRNPHYRWFANGIAQSTKELRAND